MCFRCRADKVAPAGRGRGKHAVEVATTWAGERDGQYGLGPSLTTLDICQGRSNIRELLACLDPSAASLWLVLLQPYGGVGGG